MKLNPNIRKHLLLFAMLMFTAVYANAQNYSIKIENQSLSRALAEITRVTGYKFVYSSAVEAKLGETTSIECNNEKITSILDKLFAGKQISYKIEGKNIALAPATATHSPGGKFGTVKGKVADETTGEPLAGVAVMNEASKNMSLSDSEGNYSIAAKEGDILDFSLMGMESYYATVGKKAVVDIILKPDVIALEDVIVTGYQTISKERATGSFENVGDKLLDRPHTSVEQSLVGNIAGLQVVNRGYGTSRDEQIVIRGITSLGSNARPLVVVDGFPIDGSLSSLNPNDIASISVLKDAAAASIWGARSANGVIVVTSKSGKKGKVSVEFNAFVKASDYFDLDYANPLATSAETVEYEKLGFSTSFFNRGSYMADNYSSAIYGDYNRMYSQASVLMNENRLGYISDGDLTAALAKLSSNDNRDQIRKYIMAKPFTQQYNLSISNATDRTNNYLTLMYQNDLGYFQGDCNSTYMINYRSTVSPYRWLDISFSSMFQYQIEKTKNGSVSILQKMSPYDMLLDANGNYLHVQNNLYLPIIQRNIVDKGINFPYSNWTYNPLQEMRETNNSINSLSSRFQLGLTFKLAKGFEFVSKMQYELSSFFSKNLFGENSYRVRFNVNECTTWDGNPNTTPSQNWAKGMAIQESSETSNGYDFRNQLNFDRTFNEKNAISVIAGTEVSNKVTMSNSGPLMYGYNDAQLSLTPPLNGVQSGYNYFFNMFGQMEFSNSPSYPFGNRDYATDRFFSIYANASYTYDRKYTLSASARSDASNLISSDPSIRYSPFWSVGALWNVTEENFMKSYDWVDRLALRATYGFNGNVDKSTSVDPLISIFGSNFYTGTDSGIISNFGNPYLRWERTGTLDLGFDYSLFNGKLFGKFDYYDKEGRDLISTVSTPVVYGSDSQSMNAISMYNKGVELTVGTSLSSGDFNWTGNFSFAYNKNKITKLYKDAGTLAYRVYGHGSGWEYTEGYDASTLWVFKYGGVQEVSGVKQPVIIDKNGENPRGMNTYNTSFDSQNYLVSAGPAVAPWVVGFNSSFSYKNLSLSVLMTGYFGHKFIRTGFNYPEMNYGVGNINKYYSEVKNGSSDDFVPIPDFASGETYPRYLSGYSNVLDYLVCDASNIRIQEINLTYSLDKDVVNKIGIGGLSIYGQLNDVGVILFNKYGQDPFYPLGSIKPGISGTLGLKFNF